MTVHDSAALVGVAALAGQSRNSNHSCTVPIYQFFFVTTADSREQGCEEARNNKPSRQSSSLQSSKETPMLKNVVRGIAVGLLTLSLGVYAEAKPKNGGGNTSHNGPNLQTQYKPTIKYQGPGNNQGLNLNLNKNVSPKYFCKPVNPSCCYKGHDCCFWSHCCWCNWLGCEIYWCPVSCQWFYYCEPACCYYLVVECPGY
jgi:hypothetical protein